MRPLKTFFADDTRAVAPLIGFILLFGIAVLAFSGYQAVQVPQQNAETEFQHYENVQNDLTVVRNAISKTGQQNEEQFESVRLGTAYQERIFALNPPAPTGTLRTSGEAYPIRIERPGGNELASVPTRFLQYQNGYNELEVAPIYYENSVLYLSDSDGREAVIFEEQNLVRGDGTVVITALQNELNAASTGRVTLELYPTDEQVQIPPGQVNVSVPTRLSDEYWTTALEDELGSEDVSVFDDGTYPGDVQVLEIQLDSNDLEVNTVGINSVPDPGVTPNPGGPPDEPGPPDNGDETGGGDQLPGTLTAQQYNDKGDQVVEISYTGSERIDIIVNPTDQEPIESTIPAGDDSIKVDLGGDRGLPIDIFATNDSGNSCSGIVEKQNEEITIC